MGFFSLSFGVALSAVYITVFVLAVRQTRQTATRASRCLQTNLWAVMAVIALCKLTGLIQLVIRHQTKPIRSVTTVALLAAGLPAIESFLMVVAVGFCVCFMLRKPDAHLKTTGQLWAIALLAVCVPAGTGFAAGVLRVSLTHAMLNGQSGSYRQILAVDVTYDRWGWFLIFVNTGMTSAILAKIIRTTNTTRSATIILNTTRIHYRGICVAFIQSALLASVWAATNLYHICNLILHEQAVTCKLPIDIVRAVFLNIFSMVMGGCQCLIVICLGQLKRRQEQSGCHIMPSLPAMAIQEAPVPPPSVYWPLHALSALTTQDNHPM